MRTHELFEQPVLRQERSGPAAVVFALVLTDQFTEQDADRVAQTIADQTGGQLDDRMKNVEAAHEEEDSPAFVSYTVFVPEEKINDPRKILRRLQRGKPTFSVRFIDRFHPHETQILLPHSPGKEPWRSRRRD